MSSGRRLVLSGIALTALLAVVAVASHAHRPGGGSGGGTADAPKLIFEYAASIAFVLFPFGVVAVLWVASVGRRQKLLEGRVSKWQQFRSLLLICLLGLPAVFAARHFFHYDSAQQGSNPTSGASRVARRPDVPTPTAEFQWLPALLVGSIILALVAGVIVAIVWRRRRGADWDEEAALSAALDEVLADTLDDLRAERDPRRAVIAAFARMEKTFAAHRVAREASETPREYVERALDRLGVSVSSVRQLTSLYERAKFSRLAIDDSMKRDAIDALAGLRAELEPEARVAA
ncbi:MAG: DUF4129 domain-containing protein [Gaiellaceae bacterium]